MGRLEHVDDVAEASIEFKIEAYYAVNDPYRHLQPHYDRINLNAAWDLTAGDPAVSVNVVDTGTDLNHQDLQRNIWQNPGEVCDNGVDDDGNGYVDDCHGYNFADDTGADLLGSGSHGTHCAGTIAADSDNAVGVAGVAGGKGGDAGASIMTSVCFGVSATKGFAEAIVYGADEGARVSSNSWGYTQPGVRVRRAELLLMNRRGRDDARLPLTNRGDAAAATTRIFL